MRSGSFALVARTCALVLVGVLAPPLAGAQEAPVRASSNESSAPAMPGSGGEERSRRALPGYLSADTLDILAVLPPPPTKGDPRYDAERRVFRNTRKLKDSARWQLATQDADLSPADLLRGFSCALGVELTPAQAPKIVQVAQKATRDAGRAVGVAKTHFGKARPFQIDRGPTCRPAESVGKSSDYPSGHSVAGWTWALVLAQIAPDRASQLLARGRAYGDSRIVCGMHNPSAVEAGRLSGSAVMARVAAEPAYRADLEAARQELEALRREAPAPDAARCASEAELIAAPIF